MDIVVANIVDRLFRLAALAINLALVTMPVVVVMLLDRYRKD
jgi:hypothetical protein